MPVKRGKNLRSGDLAEQLGLYLIQSLALVAPVPRTEDIGIDVVATLLADGGSYNYLAEDSFFIQIKSNSISEIIYDKDGVKWLHELKLPLLIASVDRNRNTIRLFSTKRMFDAFAIEKNRKIIKLKLEEEESFNTYDFVDKREDDIYIGPAIIEWSVEQLMKNEKETRNRFYQLVKEHVRIIYESMELQEIGAGSTYKWETNVKPIFFSYKYSSNTNINFEDLKRRTQNNLYKLLDLCSRFGNREVFDEIYSDLEDYEEVYKNYEDVRNMKNGKNGIDTKLI